MTISLDAMHGLAPVINSLPGEPVPYYLASGEGQRFEIDNQLWTVIARSADSDGSLDAAFVLGPRGASTPPHALPAHQRSFFVFDGSVEFSLLGESRVLVPGDSIHVPPGVPVAYRMLSHMSRFLLWSAPGGAFDALLASTPGVERHVYSARPDAAPVFQESSVPQADSPGYFISAFEGDRLAWPDAMNSFSARGRDTGGKYVAVTTLAAPQPYIPRHFHSLHTENFFCLSGRIWLWVNGRELLLTSGDFVHAPAGTVHSFAIDGHNTRMLGLLTTDIFEPFLDVTGEPTQDFVYTEGLINPQAMMGKLRGAADLDVTFVGPPPERVVALGI